MVQKTNWAIYQQSSSRQFLLCAHIQSLLPRCTISTNELRLPHEYPRLPHKPSLLEGFYIHQALDHLKFAGVKLVNTTYKRLLSVFPIPIPETFELEIDHDQLNQAIHHYLSHFREGTLKWKRKYFPYTFSFKIFDTFIKEISPYEGERIAFEFAPLPNKKDHILDGFLESFRKHDPNAFCRWQKKEYDFLWFPTLYAYSQDTKLGIGGFRLDPPELLQTEPDQEEEKLKLSIRRWIYLRRKPIRVRKISTNHSQPITSIQIERAFRGRFGVYFNHEYDYSFHFSVKSKIGSMIYKIATSRKRHADFYDYTKEFYKVNDKRFRFFANPTPFVYRKILTRKDKNKISFHSDLLITLIQNHK